MAALRVNFVDRSRYAIGGRELPLLDRALNMYIVVLLEGKRYVCDLAIKDQAVPIAVGLLLTITALKLVAFFQASVGHFRP